MNFFVRSSAENIKNFHLEYLKNYILAKMLPKLIFTFGLVLDIAKSC